MQWKLQPGVWLDRLLVLVLVSALACNAPAAAQIETAPPPEQVPSKHDQDAAEEHYLAGARALDRKDLVKAQAEFDKAVALDPSSKEYAVAAALAREHRVTELIHEADQARTAGQAVRADALLKDARALDPQNSFVEQHADAASSAEALPVFQSQVEPEGSETDTGPDLAGPVKLTPNETRRSFHARGNVRDIVTQVVSAYGIKPVFDSSVRPLQVRLDVDDANYNQAAGVMFQMAHLFAVPLDSRHLLVIQDTADNRKRYERQLQETIYAAGLSAEQLNELKNVVSNVFDIKKPSTLGSTGALVVEAPETTLNAVNRTMADMLDDSNEILLDLSLYTVARTRTRDIGTTLPQQIGVYSVASEAQNLVSSNQSIVNQAIAEGLIPADASNVTIALALIASGLVQDTLLSSTIGLFGGGLTMGAVTASPYPSFNLSLNSSDTKALDHLQLRVSDGQEATFKAGERYPIATGIYSSAGTSSSALSSAVGSATINGVSAASLLSQSYSIPQIQYEDIGLKLKAKPMVHSDGRILLQLDLQIEALDGTGIQGIPILDNRQFISSITVRDGETTLLASTMSEQESAAVNGLPGLGELPGFQSAVAGKTTEKDTSELVLLITPHLVRKRPNLLAGPRIAFNEPGQD